MYVNLPCYSFHLHYITLYSQLPEIAVQIHIYMYIYITHIFFLHLCKLHIYCIRQRKDYSHYMFVEQLLEMQDTYSSHPRCYANHET